MSDNSSVVIGLDLGTSKTGASVLEKNEDDGLWHCTHLDVVETDQAFGHLSELIDHPEQVIRIVVDAPIGRKDSVESYRPVDKLFMRGQFNNNHVGLQPNNPGLLNIDYSALTASLRQEWGIAWSDDWDKASSEARLMRETFPNPVLGMLFAPEVIKEQRRLLRFRFGRGRNVPVVSAVWDLIAKQGTSPSFFDLLDQASALDWSWLSQMSSDRMATSTENRQGDDLIAALTCALVGAHEVNGTAGHVRVTNDDESDFSAGHYLLPHRDHIHPRWLQELQRLTSEADFSSRIRHTYAQRE